MIFIVLLAWQLEIETLGNMKLRILSFPGSTLSQDDERALGPTLRQPGFAELFSRAQALSLRLETGSQIRTYVLLNNALIARTGNDKIQLIAHEFGHHWLAAQGMLPPAYVPGPRGCLAVHAGDIVQHILLRRELDRRGFSWRESYARDYQQAFFAAGNQPRGDACFRAQRLSLMMDIRTGFAAGAFDARNAYLAWLGEQDREAEAIAVELEESLQELDAKDYDAALKRVLDIVERF
jgi:hypothetical protein